MKILYVSDNIYHHMIPLAKALVREVGDDNFKYAILKPIEESRVKMGFDSNDEIQPWAIKVYESKENLIEFEKWFDKADVVLFSNRDLFKMSNIRIQKNKLTFYFSERWWKPDTGRWRLLHPKYFKLALEIRKLSKNSNFHYLAQGGYAAKDIRFISKFENRIWDFGYFTDTSSSNISQNNSDKINILWCGRMLKWKRVDTLIKAFGEVVKTHTNCHLNIIGDGEEKSKLEIMAEAILPDNSYSFFPSQSINVIRQKMYNSDIFVLTSSGYEGWGAVVNEAMSESCAVIASVESGAGKSMINHMENGILFFSGDWKMLSKKIMMLVKDEKLRIKIAKNGQKAIKEIWSPDVAANRFVKVCDALIKKTSIPNYETGPFKKSINK